MPTYTPVTSRANLARLFRFVEESPRGSNKGRWVEALQRIGNTEPGEPWCACLVTAVLDMYYAGRNPLPASASCEALHNFAKSYGWITPTPQPDDVYLVLNALGAAHHTGIVVTVADDYKSMTEISGNTNDDGSREGYAVIERTRLITPQIIFIHLPERHA